MPTYDYKCKACEHRFEVYQSFSENPIKKCPQCKKLKIERLISGGIGFTIKGTRENDFSDVNSSFMDRIGNT